MLGLQDGSVRVNLSKLIDIILIPIYFMI